MVPTHLLPYPLPMTGPVLIIPPNLLALAAQIDALAKSIEQLLNGRKTIELKSSEFDQFFDLLQRREKMRDELAWKMRAVNFGTIARIERRMKGARNQSGVSLPCPR